MPNQIKIFNRIKPFNKTIEVTSDKSLSIRAILLASQAIGVSTISNLLESEDVLNAVRSIKKLGIKCKKIGNQYKILGYGLNGFEIKKNIIKIVSDDPIIEKPTAVPRNGALHGVANKVANIPLR